VAKEAIQEASRNGSDVVLVDTAGRMQVIIAVVVARVY
jgi:signal recognition particle receptor subunit alpha